ncbi:hypothetical protein ACMFMF_001423 [Clarireedia jacksonii]
MHPTLTQKAMLADASNFDEWLTITMKWRKGKTKQEGFDGSEAKKTRFPTPPTHPPKSRFPPSPKVSLPIQRQLVPFHATAPKPHLKSPVSYKPQPPSPEKEEHHSSSPAHPTPNINTTAALPSPLQRKPLQFESEFFEVRKSPKGGFGCFAVKDIPVRTIIHSEKPLFECSMVGVHYAFEQLTPEQREEYLSLYYYRGLTNHKVVAIYQTNRFYMTGATSGIFPKSSRFNHACLGFRNCTYELNKETREMVFTTIQDVVKGQELTISYCSVPNDLYRNYGFFCDCPGCPPVDQAMREWKTEEALREAGNLQDAPEDKPWDEGVLYNF